MYNEWKNLLMRESIAQSSLIKLRSISSSTYFKIGKIIEIATYLENTNANVLFVNDLLTPIQQSKLEKRLNDILNGRDEKIRRTNIKQIYKQENSPTEINTESTLISLPEDNKKKAIKDIRIIDRFGIILQIFSMRAKSDLAKMQIQLCWIKYSKGRLFRNKDGNYGALTHIYTNDILKSALSSREIVSAKQRGGTKSTSGSGETQLELEKRRLKEYENSIKEKIDYYKNLKTKRESYPFPKVSLVGYTNAGKTALMNRLAKTSFESEDMLFQTLHSTTRKIYLKEGQKCLLVDTIGFISRIPIVLMEPFKSTFSEVLDSDLIIHIIDMSNPGCLLQRETVLKILSEIGAQNLLSESKCIEAWNKCDICSDKENENKVKSKTQYTNITISALFGEGIKELINTIMKMVVIQTGKQRYSIKFHYSENRKRLQWLKLNGAAVEMESLRFLDNNEEMSINAIMNEVTYVQYQLYFGEKVKNKPSIRI